MHDTKLSLSAKGKAREDAHWQFSWWDLFSLTEYPTRPIAWSRSSVIFTPHPTQPLVIARHFPSSRQFILPTPPAFASVPVTYEPPSIISISPSDDWLYAYFAGNDGDGASCLWKRTGQLDNWNLQEWWIVTKGSGVVAAEWISQDREWVLGDQEQPYRLPPRGPILHTNAPVLLLVTQTHQVHICFMPSAVIGFKVVKATLLHPCAAGDGQPPQEDLPASSRGGQKVCTNAAIGMNYNDNTIVIAMRSHLLPPHGAEHAPFNTMDLSLHLDMADSSEQNDSLIANEWEQWGEQSTVELSMLLVRCTGATTAIRVQPVAPLRRPGSRLTGLRFCAVPPDIVPPSPTITRDPRRPVKDGMTERGSLYLIASFLDFDDFTSLPKSEVTTFPLVTSKSREIMVHPKGERTRTFDVGTVAFLAPSPSAKRLIVGFLDSSGTINRRHAKSKETPIGSISILNPIDLTIDDQWEPSHIISPSDGVGRDTPLGVAISPNHALICGISPSTTVSARTTVYAVPHLKQVSTPGPPKNDLSRAVVTSILSRKSPSDVIHALIMPSTPLDEVLNTLYNSLRILEAHSFGQYDMWIEDMLGIITEIYLGRAQHSEVDAEKAMLQEWGKTAHDMTSVAALNTAFEDCRDGDAYDLEAVWQLVGLSLWFMGLLERLLKQCVYMGNDAAGPSENSVSMGDGACQPDPDRSSGASILINLLHPYAAGNLHAALQHVKRFRDDLKSLSPKSENAYMAKGVFMDGVEDSGVRLDALEPLLQEVCKEAQKLPGK
ncbi:hypothetical protein NM688_g6664 [Phlebia brevispora]|uniref:Uncharacterized protein n=1 Tax=Phlebia brevispora TaxID=194682 RepID=A0ACC1SDP5_9APHY|nr:hypothetical protein NM688_g6664 [Phlebia brevispora]